MNYTTLTSCIACGGSNLKQILNLGNHPLANSYHRGIDLPYYPLRINLCTDCFHVQQKIAVNPDLMFKQYAYVSGTSKTAHEDFDEFAKKQGKPGRVLDIACNDGSQLASFMKEGWEAWGVEPAENLIPMARATGATVIDGYWDFDTVRRLNRKFDLVTAQNVFAHVKDPLNFLLNAKLVMHKDSKLSIRTSQADMFEHYQFDTIYHEHISFFSVRSMVAVAGRAGLNVEDVYITPIHGGSYVFTLGCGTPKTSVIERALLEGERGRYSLKLYRAFAENVEKVTRDLRQAVTDLREQGRLVIGYGAAAKGNTLLNYTKVNLEYIVDDSPLKQGLLTPGMNIPIVSSERLKNETRALAIIPLAWNFYDEIYKRVKTLRSDKDDLFILYFPSTKIRT